MKNETEAAIEKLARDLYEHTKMPHRPTWDESSETIEFKFQAIKLAIYVQSLISSTEKATREACRKELAKCTWYGDIEKLLEKWRKEQERGGLT